MISLHLHFVARVFECLNSLRSRDISGTYLVCHIYAKLLGHDEYLFNQRIKLSFKHGFFVNLVIN